uniref:Secreted protein n=1 Tax=Parascaris univalens TaxID=6257 RepID=A0A915BDX5_PARUN
MVNTWYSLWSFTYTMWRLGFFVDRLKTYWAYCKAIFHCCISLPFKCNYSSNVNRCNDEKQLKCCRIIFFVKLRNKLPRNKLLRNKHLANQKFFFSCLQIVTVGKGR